jgi:hypothetical protein
MDYFLTLLLQWQGMSGAIISNYCARFGKQQVGPYLIDW